GVHAAVVELDALADPVRAAAQHHDLVAAGRLGLALFLVGRVQVGRGGGELGGAGIYALVHRADAERAAQRAHGLLLHPDQRGQAGVGEAHALELAQAGGVERVHAPGLDLPFGRDDVLDLVEEPRIHPGQAVPLPRRQAGAGGVDDVEQALGARLAEFAPQGGQALLAAQVQAGRIEAGLAGLEPAQGLLHRLLEGAADGHDFAHRLHLGGQARVGLRELLEGEARDLGDDVVDRGLERGRGPAAGDLVPELVQRVAHGQLGGDLSVRDPGVRGGQPRRARHARVHLDHHHPTGLGVDAELHVRAAGVDADLAQHVDRGLAQALVLAVGQGLRRGHGDRVAGVHAHGVEVLDRADDDAVVRGVADHLHLELLPAQHRLLDQDLAHRGQLEAALGDLLELLAVVGDAAAAAAQGEGRPDDGRVADPGLDLDRLLEALRDLGLRALEADLLHGHAEQLAVLGHADGLALGADQLDAVLFEHAVVGQVERAVERGLAAHRGQQRVGLLLGDDLLDRLPVDR